MSQNELVFLFKTFDFFNDIVRGTKGSIVIKSPKRKINLKKNIPWGKSKLLRASYQGSSKQKNGFRKISVSIDH